MTFSLWLRTRRRTLVTLLGAVLGAVAAGAAIGLAGASLSGGDRTATSPPPDAQPARGDPTRLIDVNVRIVSAILHPAGTARGRSRQRARLSVHARVTNRRDRTIALGRPKLHSGLSLLEIDAHADKLAGALLRPLRPGSTADGVLRYETAGTITQRLTTMRRFALRIAGRTIRAKIKVGSPARRAQ